MLMSCHISRSVSSLCERILPALRASFSSGGAGQHSASVSGSVPALHLLSRHCRMISCGIKYKLVAKHMLHLSNCCLDHRLRMKTSDDSFSHAPCAMLQKSRCKVRRNGYKPGVTSHIHAYCHCCISAHTQPFHDLFGSVSSA